MRNRIALSFVAVVFLAITSAAQSFASKAAVRSARPESALQNLVNEAPSPNSPTRN